MRRASSLIGLPRRFAWWASSPSGLIWLFAIGFVIRIVLASRPGFAIDMGTFRAWSNDLATKGMSTFYPQDFNGGGYFIDYPPGYLYVLWFLGKISQLLTNGPPSDFLLKIPAVFGDLGLAWVVIKAAERVTPASYRRYPWKGIAASAILLNPAVIFVSSVWGQVDVFLGLLVLAGFVVLCSRTPSMLTETAGLALLVLAVATKPQAVFVVPLAVLLLGWRYLRGVVATSGWAGAPFAIARVAGLGLVSAGIGLAILAPFGLGPSRALDFYAHASGTYKFTSVFAFNLWGAYGFWRVDAGANAVKIAIFTAFTFGLLAFAVGTVLLLARAWRALSKGEFEGRVAIFGAAAMTLIAFAVLTRIHERYLFLAVACLAPLTAYKALRRAFIVLTGLYFVNVVFAYAYYSYYFQKPTKPAAWIDVPFRAIYGDPGMVDTPQRRVVALVTGLFCLLLAFRGWRWMQDRSGSDTALASDEPPHPVPAPEPQSVAVGRWALDLHHVGVKGFALALVVFALAMATRLPGLETPPGMYFDEVYHARTAGEYLQKREVYEWTHPPLAKEIMAMTTRYLSRFEAHLATSTANFAAPAASTDSDVVVTSGRSHQTITRVGRSDGCVFKPVGPPISTGGTVTAIAAKDRMIIAGVDDGTTAELVKFSGRTEVWRTPIPGAASSVSILQDTIFVVTSDGSLLQASAEGVVQPLDNGAAAVSEPTADSVVWVSFPERREIVSYGTDAASRDTVKLSFRGGPISAPPLGDRILASSIDGNRIESVDAQTKTLADKPDLGRGADMFTSIPRTGLVWAAGGTQVRIIEPRGLAVIGHVRLPGFPSAIVPAGQNSVAAIIPGVGVACITGHPTFGWRIGSAFFGSLMIAMVFLLALRLFGSVAHGLLSALFLAVCGLAFVMSRIAMNDSYVTAFMLAAWFAVLSALYHWGSSRDPAVGRRRGMALGWLLACGALSGMSLASKWVGLFAIGGIGLLLIWDIISRGRGSIASVAGHPVVSLLVLGALLLVIPAAEYIASYIPYFRLGHNFSELIQLQKDMYGYHAHLTADHPFGSAWYKWPSGRKAVYLFLYDPGSGRRAEMWSAANPVVFLGGLAAMLSVAVAAVRRRSVAAAVIVLGGLVQYLPWVRVTRVTFLYHYLSVTPFLALALGWWLTSGPAFGVDLNAVPRLRKLETALVAGAAVVVFAALLPILDGWLLPGSLVDGFKWMYWVF